MNSIQKFWLGFFTFLPILFIVLFFGFFFTVFLGNIEALDNSHHNEFPMEFMQSMMWFVILIIIMAMVSLGIKIYYIVHANNNKESDTNKKVMWTLLLIFVGTVGSIVYYFVEILPINPKEISS